MLDQPRQGIVPPRQHQVLGQLALDWRNLGERHDVRWMDDGQVQPGFDGVVEKHGVDDLAGDRIEPERDIRDAQDRHHPGHVRLDGADAVQCLERRANELFITGRERERHVEDQRLGRQPILADHDVVDLARRLELAARRLRHALFVDRHRHHGGAVRQSQRHDRVDLEPSILHVDRIDDGAAGILLQRVLEDVRLGGVEHQRRLDVQRQLFDQRAQHLPFVGALRHRHADVERVCATVDLLAGDDDHSVVVIRQRQPLDLARAERIDLLADDQWRRVLPQIDRTHHRRRHRQWFRWARTGGRRPIS